MATLTVSKDEEKRLKGLGFLSNKNTDNFSGRVITGNGIISAEDLEMVARAAREFGNGKIGLTSRLTLEVQGIPYEKCDEFYEHIKNNGLMVGGTGAKVRPVVSCKGTLCQFGMIDTFSLSEKIHQEFFLKWQDVALPHKFKITVGGCPNNCAKPNLNDIGIMGFGKDTYKVFIGGHWGKTGGVGHDLGVLLKSEDEVLALIEKILTFYRDNGESRERFYKVIDRIGIEKVKKEILG